MMRFMSPEPKWRPMPFWSWNDRLEPAELKRQIDAMRSAGYGGFFMHSRVGLVTKYLSDEWMEDVRACADYAEQQGLFAWLYDEDMWPSGYAAGAVPAASDDFKEKALVLVDESALRPGDEVFAERVQKGQKKLIVRRTCSAGNVRFGGQCYLDTLNPDAVACFLESTHRKYQESVGDMFGRELSGVFTDEACYGIHWFYTEPHVTYSEHLRSRILSNCGYDIKDCCAQLFFDEGDYRKVRYDYFTQAGAQFTESFTLQYAQWCRQNKLKLTGHLMAEETFYEQAQWTGGVMASYEHMDVPGIDKLFKANTQIVTVKQLTSVTEQLGKERALSECFAGIGHDAGYLKRKQIMDWQAVLGINLVNMHLSHYSMRGERKRDYPPNIFYQQPYFADENVFSDYAARLSMAAAYGKRSVSVLVLCPLAAVFSRYNPNDPNNEAELKESYDRPFYELSQALAGSRIDFHYGDETILARHGSASDGLLRVGCCAYDTVVLPGMDVLSGSTLALLRAFRGTICVLGEAPVRVDGLLQETGLTFERYSGIEELIAALKARGKVSLQLEGDAEEVFAVKRTDEEGELYLLANTGGQDRTFRIPASDRERWLLCLSDGTASRLPEEAFEVRLCVCGSLCLWLTSRKRVEESGARIVPLPGVWADGAVLRPSLAQPVSVLSAARLCENALPLEHVEFFADGKRVTDRVHLSKIWHYHFYPLPEGTPFRLVYRFRVKELPDGPLFAVIENAENLDFITLNGKRIKPLRRRGEPQFLDNKAYADVSFTRCPVDGLLQAGVNELTLEGKKCNNVTEVCCHRSVETGEAHFPTEAETVYLVGNFSLEPCGDEFAVKRARELHPGDAAAQGCPFYSGALAYTCGGIPEGTEQLRLDGDFVYAEVQLGGRTLRAGGNPCVVTLPEGCPAGEPFTVTLTDSLFALLGPHHIEGYDELPWVDPGVFNDLSRYRASPLIKPFGLRAVTALRSQAGRDERL